MASFLLRRLKQSRVLHRFQCDRMMSAGSNEMLSNSASDESPSSSTSKLSPWLVLPPAVEASGDTVYKFYNLSDNRIETGVKLPPDHNDAVLVGSSHGWLAFFNDRNNRVFLSNPLTGRQLNLPPIHTLPYPEINLRDGRGTVSKVILSCSPDDDDNNTNDDDVMCRAMMSFGPGDRLAFCPLPDPGECWTPIGDLFFKAFGYEYKPGFAYGRAYEDFVYCTTRKLFSCITDFSFSRARLVPDFPTDIEEWDLCDPDSPRSRVCDWMTWLTFEREEEKTCHWLKYNEYVRNRCKQIAYLVFADHLYIVTRFVCDSESPCKTVGFSVVKVVYNKKGVVEKLVLVGSLDGLAMFVGINHSFVVPAAQLGLKTNCIYFTDAVNTRLSASSTYDIGIFDYEKKIVSKHVYDFPHDQSLTGVVPLPPTWFTPSRC